MAVAFRNLPVSLAGCCAWRKRGTGQQLSTAAQRRADLLAKIIAIHRDDDTYGAPRITAELRAGGELAAARRPWRRRGVDARLAAPSSLEPVGCVPRSRCGRASGVR